MTLKVIPKRAAVEDDQQPGYELLFVLGKLAWIEESADRHWEKLAVEVSRDVQAVQPRRASFKTSPPATRGRLRGGLR